MNRFVNAITTLKLPFCAFKEHLNSSKAAASVALLFQIFSEGSEPDSVFSSAVPDRAHPDTGSRRISLHMDMPLVLFSFPPSGLLLMFFFNLFVQAH